MTKRGNDIRHVLTAPSLRARRKVDFDRRNPRWMDRGVPNPGNPLGGL